MEASLRLANVEKTRRALTRKLHFTAPLLNSLPTPASRSFIHDTKVRGLALMMTTAGSKSFYLYKRIQGRPERIRIGDFPEVTIDQARNEAMKLLAKIIKGENPQADKRRIRSEMTFGELFTWYLTNHANLRKRTAGEDQQKFDKFLKPWATRPLALIRRSDVQALHVRLSKETPGGANRLLALLSVIFNKARIIGWEGGNPAEGIQRNKEHSRERFLSDTELPKFLKALADEPNQTWRDFFSLCLWTGARSGNVKSMKWDELDIPAGTWRIPDAKFKTGRGMTVHLAAPAIEILTARKSSAGDSPYVFPAPGESGHLQEPKKAWTALLARAGIVDLWIHDLRRTLGSWQAASGASLHVIGKSLGHVNTSTTAIYARLNLDPVKQSVNTAVAAMLATGQTQPPAAKPKRKAKAAKQATAA